MLRLEIILASCAVAAFAYPSPSEDGKWIPEKFGDTGRYMRPPNEGKYIHIPNPYIHIHNPYDGGYGPYSHIPDPYIHEESRDVYRFLAPDDANPYYRPGYYRNNGIKILEQKHNYQNDKYDFKFKTENKIQAQEEAVIKNANTPDEGIASKGFYEYIGPDGFLYRVTYTADENGFRPKMERLPTPYSGKWVKEKVIVRTPQVAH